MQARGAGGWGVGRGGGWRRVGEGEGEGWVVRAMPVHTWQLGAPARGRRARAHGRQPETDPFQPVASLASSKRNLGSCYPPPDGADGVDGPDALRLRPRQAPQAGRPGPAGRHQVGPGAAAEAGGQLPMGARGWSGGREEGASGKQALKASAGAFARACPACAAGGGAGRFLQTPTPSHPPPPRLANAQRPSWSAATA